MDAPLAKFETLVSQSQVIVAILGEPALDSFELIHLEPVTMAKVEEVSRRENFVGLCGFAGFKPRLALAVELDDAALKTLSAAFTQLVSAAMDRLDYWLKNNFKNPPTNRTEEN
jgi:hypothetical protein